MRRRAPVRSLAAAGALGLLALAGCSSDREALSAPPIEGQPEGTGPQLQEAASDDVRSIVMVGDSITVGAQPSLEGALDELDVDVLALDGANGRRLAVEGLVSSGVQAIEAVRSLAEPDLWVVALGTNDVALYETDDGYREAIDALLDELPEDAPVVWVDVYLAASAERSDDFNDALRDVLDGRGNATIVDWSTVAAQDGVLADGIHPGEVGVEVFADLVAGGVADRLG